VKWNHLAQEREQWHALGKVFNEHSYSRRGGKLMNQYVGSDSNAHARMSIRIMTGSILGRTPTQYRDTFRISLGPPR